ncbi:MAG: DUF2752 domain-containing protein [Crocinitomicaceae bacterium]
MNIKLKSSAILIVLLFLPLILLYLPADYFDTGGVTVCPSKRFLDIECLGCGITRGIQHTIHGEFEIGWQFNKLSPIVLAVLIYLWIKYFIQAVKALKKAQ